jgi:uncharacterized protein YqeY
MLKDKIHADYMTALKNKDVVTKNLLSVIKGSIQSTEKNQMVNDLSDDKVIEILKQIAKSTKETISLMQESTSKELAKKELETIESYLPKQMSEDEIRVKVQELISENDLNIAEVMRIFSTLQADRKLVAEVYHSLKGK